MRVISHRGNLKGPKSCEENSPEAIKKALSFGFDVEVDLRTESDGSLFLGHDKPEYPISLGFLADLESRLWIHCKDFGAVRVINNVDKVWTNWFYHADDMLTHTSSGIIWAQEGAHLKNGVAILSHSTKLEDVPEFLYGICTDYPLKFRKLL
jgi:glycerophosphoryl diester phosphodiesterase